MVVCTFFVCAVSRFPVAVTNPIRRIAQRRWRNVGVPRQLTLAAHFRAGVIEFVAPRARPRVDAWVDGREGCDERSDERSGSHGRSALEMAVALALAAAIMFCTEVQKRDVDIVGIFSQMCHLILTYVLEYTPRVIAFSRSPEAVARLFRRLAQ